MRLTVVGLTVVGRAVVGDPDAEVVEVRRAAGVVTEHSVAPRLGDLLQHQTPSSDDTLEASSAIDAENAMYLARMRCILDTLYTQKLLQYDNNILQNRQGT